VIYGKGPLVSAVISDRARNSSIEDILNDFKGAGGKHKNTQPIISRTRNTDSEKHDYSVQKYQDSNNDDFYISTQWGIGNIGPFLERAEKLGIPIETIK